MSPPPSHFYIVERLVDYEPGYIEAVIHDDAEALRLRDAPDPDSLSQTVVSRYEWNGEEWAFDKAWEAGDWRIAEQARRRAEREAHEATNKARNAR